MGDKETGRSGDEHDCAHFVILSRVSLSHVCPCQRNDYAHYFEPCSASFCSPATLAACGTSQLLADVGPATAELRPSGKGEHVDISYTIGQPAKVAVYLQAAGGARYTLREGEQRLPSPDPYVLRFDGTAPTSDPVLKRRALPSGTYTYVVQATGADGAQAEGKGQIVIGGSDSPPPMIENLVVAPATISPNADGIDDVAEITYQLPVSATVDITFTGPDGTTSYPFVAGDEEGPILQKHVWNGKTVDNALLPDGVYTYTVRAQDRFGNLVEQPGQIAIKGGGQPEVKITYSSIAPEAVMKGETITVTLRVKNTGLVPIRTYGPPSGYEYSTDDVFSSIDERQVCGQAGRLLAGGHGLGRQQRRRGQALPVSAGRSRRARPSSGRSQTRKIC